MDRFIAEFVAEQDDDLMLAHRDGVAWQKDMSYRVDVPYYEKCYGYAGSDIAVKINRARRDFVNRFVSDDFEVLDIGVGSGEFIEWRKRTWGYDVDPKAVAWLKANNKWCEHFSWFRAFTFWDVIEHLPDPEDLYFKYMFSGTRLFTCLPIFDDLHRIRESKHYRPGEHFYYFTARGFIAWMKLHRFELIGRAAFECEAGRDSILTFAFERQPEAD